MRKLYGLIASLCFVLTISSLRAQPPANDLAAFNFTINASNNQVVFTNLSVIGNEPGIRKAVWSFGDGTHQWTSPLDGITHLYTTSGTFEVCLKIYRYRSAANDSVLSAHVCKTVLLSSVCNSNFDYRDSLISINPLKHLVKFYAFPLHNTNKAVTQVCWNFGDGTDTCITITPNTPASNFLTIHHTYNQPGPFNVCLKIKYLDGCVAEKCKPVTLTHSPRDSCQADFERLPVTNNHHPSVAVFRALPKHSQNKKPKTICWKFGDGRDTCLQYSADYNGPYVVSHRYELPGQYETCVKILYYGGCEARKCKPVSIAGERCEVTIHEITPSINSFVRGLYASVAAMPASPPLKICWNFGDGTDTCIIATSSTPPDLLIRHTYPAPGIYRACVKVLFANGCRAEDCNEVVIRSNNNLCGGYMTDSLTGPRSFLFKGFSISRPNDPVISYRWSFGDGATAIGREVSHSYQSGGDFEVCLYIKTALGCETRICKKIRVPGNNQPALVLTPNPVINVLHVFFRSTHSETVTIKLLNANGVMIRTIYRQAIQGENNWDFEVSGLSPGIYTLAIQSPNQTSSAIFIKL